MTDVDALFEVPLGEFVAARNELAGRLRQEGKPEEAAEVAALKKPPVPVWVVNQLARRQRRDVDLLLDAGHRLRAAQGEADPDQARDAFQTARDAEREAIGRLRTGAQELLTEEQGRATPAMVERVLGTLRSAAVSEEGRELLARGRLTEELETTGFDLAATLVPKRKTRPAKAPKRDDVAAARKGLEEARKRERAAARRLHQAELRAQEAQEGLAEAGREADEAAAAVAEAEEALARARRKR